MTYDEYLAAVLAAQKVGDDDVALLHKHRDEVEQLLRDELGQAPRIRFGGSLAKATMIKESFDLDILCYFPYDDKSSGNTLEDTFNAVRDALKTRYAVVVKRCALRLHNIDTTQPNRDYHVDVVPGRYVDASHEDTWLYVTTPEKRRLKTNIEKHVTHIQSSTCHREIRLSKLWNIRKGLGIPTFVLELLVVKGLKGRTFTTAGDGMTSFWTYVRDTEALKVEDPANPDGNDLSDLLDVNAQARLKHASRDALVAVERGEWPATFGPVDGHDTAAKVRSAATGVAFTKPWSG